jgi:hypothetical protein
VIWSSGAYLSRRIATYVGHRPRAPHAAQRRPPTI